MKRLPLHKRPYFASPVLEIGGGHDPYVGVTHAIDKYPDDSTQRGGSLVVGKGVEFKIGDLEEIPYGDEPKFQFLYASHVLEHVNDPDRAISEINRVSVRGYIETPSPLREQIACPIPFEADKDFHTQFVWTVRGQRNTIHFIRKSAEVIGEFCDCAEGRLARRLFEFRRSRNVDLEPMLPGTSKSIQLYYRAPITLVEHRSFREACASGACAYGSASEVRKWTSVPWVLVSGRFRKLREIIA